MAQSYEEYANVVLNVNGKQAKDTMKELEKQAKGLHDMLIQAMKTGDQKEQERLRKLITANDKAIEKCTASSKRMEHALRQMDTAHPKQLRQTIKELQKQLDSGFIQRGTKEWEAQVKVIGKMKDELGKIKEEQDTFGKSSMWKSWKAAANTVWSTFDMGVRIVEAAYDKISKYIDGLVAKQEATTGLQAMTGLSDADIEWLTRQAERIATTMDETGLRVRLSSKQILEAYALVGSAKPELQADAEALNQVTTEALRLQAATGTDLQSAVSAVTITLNQYEAGAADAARFTNVLAAGAKDGAAGINDLAASFAATGSELKASNISAEQAVSLFETLALKGIKGGEAGSALQRILHTLAKTGIDELNPAAVGLDQALLNLNATQLTTDELIKLFGERGAKAARILIDSAPDIAAYTEQITGTAVATDQAARNSDTYAARAAQAANAWDEAGQRLAATILPILDEFNTGLSTVLPLIEAFASYAAKIAGMNIKFQANVLTGNWKKAIQGIRGDLKELFTSGDNIDPKSGAGGAADTGGLLASVMLPPKEEDDKVVDEARKRAEEIARRIREAIAKGSKDGTKETAASPLRQQLADLDKSAELLRNIAAIEQAHGALSEQQYAAEILRINIALYTKKRDLYQKDSAEWIAWEAKRVQEGKKAEDAQTKAITDAAAQRLQQEQAARQQAEQLRRQYDPAAAREEDMQRELALAKTLHAQGLLEEENYQRILQGIRQKYVAAEAKSKPEKAESPFRVAQADDTFGISGAFTQMLQTIEAKRMAEEEIARLEEQGNITHEQAMQRRQAIDDNTWQHYASVAQAAIGMVSNIMNAASQLMQANQDLELAKLNQRYDAEIAAAGNNEEKKKELEAKRQQEQAAIKKKYNQRAMKMEIAQAVAQTAMAAISAYASAAAVPVVGYVMAPIAAAMALAAGAIQIATIKKQHAAEEAGYYSGGYTGGHRYRREAGVVHEGEFVANHEAVRNPAVRPMLDLIDQAQRNNTIGSITPEDVSRRLTAPHRAAQLSDAITTASGGDTGENPFTVRQDPRHTAALNRLADQLQHPIHAFVTIDGPDGVKYNLDRFNQLQARK